MHADQLIDDDRGEQSHHDSECQEIQMGHIMVLSVCQDLHREQAADAEATRL